MSSSSGYYPAKNCIDGMLRTYCASDALENQWLSVMIPPNTHVGHVLVYNRIDSFIAQSFLSPYEVCVR